MLVSIMPYLKRRSHALFRTMSTKLVPPSISYLWELFCDRFSQIIWYFRYKFNHLVEMLEFVSIVNASLHGVSKVQIVMMFDFFRLLL